MEKGNVDENKKNMWEKKNAQMNEWMNRGKKGWKPQKYVKEIEMDKQREIKGQRWMKNFKNYEKEIKSREKR